ncbi:hypothetical protein QV65_04560 [Rhodococcus erythropolis]|nr:hypothetical protein QV65_04560 [Rhodococcus erythropolis]
MIDTDQLNGMIDGVDERLSARGGLVEFENIVVAMEEFPELVIRPFGAIRIIYAEKSGLQIWNRQSEFLPER